MQKYFNKFDKRQQIFPRFPKGGKYFPNLTNAANASRAHSLLLLALTLLLSLVLRFPSLRIGVRPPLVARSGPTPICIVGEAGQVT